VIKPLIAGQGYAAYLRPVIALLTRWTMLMALVLMPLGMSAAAAAAPQAMPAHNVAMQSGDHHGEAPCDEQAGRSADCAMACSMLVPDARAEIYSPEVRAEPLASRPTTHQAGLHPEMDPPPPKHS